MSLRLSLLSATLVAFATGGTASAVVQYDQNVTNHVIFGSGNLNGAFTTDRANGVELGLRGKLRHNATGAPENTFNSNGDGTYTFNPGVAPTQLFPTAVWSFEWSINTNYDDSTSWNLKDLTYSLSMTSTTGASIPAFDPIHSPNPAVSLTVQWDHAIGNNSTTPGPSGGRIVIPNNTSDAASYDAAIAGNNLAQNSWKPHWYALDFDPTDIGSYTFVLSAYDGATQVASTSATVLVPEPGSLALLGLGAGTLLVRRRRHMA